MAEAHSQHLPKSFQGLKHYSLPRQSTHDFVLLNYSAKPLHSKVSCSHCCISHNNFSESRETWWNIRKKECTRKLCDPSPFRAVSPNKRKWNLSPGKNCEILATDLTAASTWAAAISSSEGGVQKLLIHEEKEIHVGLIVTLTSGPASMSSAHKHEHTLDSHFRSTPSVIHSPGLYIVVQKGTKVAAWSPLHHSLERSLCRNSRDPGRKWHKE